MFAPLARVPTCPPAVHVVRRSRPRVLQNMGHMLPIDCFLHAYRAVSFARFSPPPPLGPLPASQARWFIGFVALTAEETLVYCVSHEAPAEGHPSTAQWYCKFSLRCQPREHGWLFFYFCLW